jgi:succinyl-CoA synthetase beta subunit
VPAGLLLRDSDVAPWPGVLKAQVLEGGRGKRGLVKLEPEVAGIPAARRDILKALGDPEAALLLEEAVAIKREIYVALRVDGTHQRLELMIAPEGGQDVENSKNLLRLPIDPQVPLTPEAAFPALAKLFPRDLAARLARFVARLPAIARAEDLDLLEINPLVVTDGGDLVACDAKLVRDDSSAFRHDAAEFPLSRALEDRQLTTLEREARDAGFQMVELPGNIALVTSGAGLGMLMMDLLADHGLAAACFMDNLRGGPADTTAERLDIAGKLAARPEIKAIMFQTVIASRSLAERVDAILAWLTREKPPKPLYVGLAAAHVATKAMSVEQGAAKLAAVGVKVFTHPLEMVRTLARDFQTK